MEFPSYFLNELLFLLLPVFSVGQQVVLCQRKLNYTWWKSIVEQIRQKISARLRRRADKAIGRVHFGSQQPLSRCFY